MECFNGNAETYAVEGKDFFVPTSSFLKVHIPWAVIKYPLIIIREEFVWPQETMHKVF